MVLYLTKWPVMINVKEDQPLPTDDLHKGFVELYNDGEISSLRIFYLQEDDDEGRLERECIQIANLERLDDDDSNSSLAFRICRLKSGIDCNEHVLIKPDRSKDCHAIYYAFRFLQQKPPPSTDVSVSIAQQSVSQKRTLVKQVSTFKQISVMQQAYDERKSLKIGKVDENVLSIVRNKNMKRKPITSADASSGSSKRHLLKSRMEEKNILQRRNTKKLKEGKNEEIGKILANGVSPKKIIVNLDEALLRVQSKQLTHDLSASSFEQLSTERDSLSPKGFVNLGNSCYINAVLQALFHVKPFKDLLNVVPESSQRTKDTLLGALKTLRKNYRRAANAKKQYLLENIFKFLGKKQFEVTKQEDAQELLMFILEKIDSELELLANNTDAEEDPSSKSLTSISSIFGFELRHKITCNKCGNEQVISEKGTFVPIHIPDEMSTKSPSLQMLLENCLKSEEVEHICPQCNENCATISHEFRSLPKCLIIFLKRYDFKHLTTKTKVQKKLNDTVKLSMRIRLIPHKRESPELDGFCDKPFSFDNSSSSDQESVVMETPPEDFELRNSRSRSGTESENITRRIQKKAPKTVQQIKKGCGDGWFAAEVQKSTTDASVVAYDFNANKKLNYLTMFCRPRPDFCKRSCDRLNIRCCSTGTLWQESKPFSRKSIPSNVAPIIADGNCLFRSIALYLSGSDEEHLIVRKSVVKFEDENEDRLRKLKKISRDNWKKYVNKMAKDGEWATEMELLALAALLDAEIWTFLEGEWLRYRPMFKVAEDGIKLDLPVEQYNNERKDAIFLINEDFHYMPVFDITSHELMCDYQLAAIISHIGDSPSSGHYVCDVRNRRKNFWMHFDDNNVEEKEEAKILPDCDKDGYIFFYITES